MDTTEFQIGDEVTFNAYHEPIRAKVVGFGKGSPLMDTDNRTWYRLEGISKPLISTCTGKNIEESKIFNLEA